MSTLQRDEEIDAQVAYDERGLVPCVVQDWSTGEVLTLAYMNEDALRRTRDTGELHLFSRSRGEQWHVRAPRLAVGSAHTVRCDLRPLLS